MLTLENLAGEKGYINSNICQFSSIFSKYCHEEGHRFDSKPGVSVSQDGCLSLCVGPMINWQLVKGVPCIGAG